MRSRAAVINIVANVTLQVVTAIAGLILPAMLIREYGSSINGMIGSIRQFIAYLGLVEAGVGAASMAALYRPLVVKDTFKIGGILSATRLFYRRSGYIFAGLLVVLAVLYPSLVGGQVDERLAFFMVLVIGMGGLAEYLLIGKYRVLLAADQQNYVVALLQSVATIISTATAVALILAGAQILLVQLIVSIISVSRFFVLRRFVRLRYPEIDFYATPIYSAINARWAAFVHQISSVVIFSSPVLLLTVFGDLREVSVYMVYSMVFTAVGSLIGVMSTGLHAGFGQLLSGSDTKELSAAFSSFEYVFFAAMAWAFACAAVLVMPFVELYSANFSDAQYSRPEVAALFLAIGIANNIRIPANVIVAAAGHFRETRNRAILEAAINGLASLALVQRFGITGVLLGSLASYSYRTFDFLIYSSHRVLGRPIRMTIEVVVRNLALAVFSVLPFFGGIRVVATSYAHWLAWAAGVSFWVFVVLATGNFAADRKMFKGTIARLKGAL